MKKNYICPTVECKALMAESLMDLSKGKIMPAPKDLNGNQIFVGGFYELGVNNNPTGDITQEAKGGMSDWDDL